MFDEQPDGDPHGECALEIRRLRNALDKLNLAAIELLKVAPKPRLLLDQYGIELQRLTFAAFEADSVLNPEHRE